MLASMYVMACSVNVHLVCMAVRALGSSILAERNQPGNDDDAEDGEDGLCWQHVGGVESTTTTTTTTW